MSGTELNLSKIVKIALGVSLLSCVCVAEHPSLGFGAQKLKGFKSHGANLKDSTTCPEVDQYWFKGAVIDNFAPIQDQKHWAGEGQRYWLNKQYWGGPGSPVFVYIGGEGAESCSRLTDHMYAYDLAKEHQALLVDVEHRFYGESYPTEDMSTQNLSYLSADQALADLARIIGYVKNDLDTASSKVVTIGGSYPGNLAAWFRLKYPSVTDGSIASSAPVTAQTNFAEYMDVVGQALIHFSGQACFDAFENAAGAVMALAAQGVGSQGMKQIETDFKTCAPITSDLDLAVLMSDLMGNVQGTVQYNNEHDGTLNVTDICAVMTSSNTAASTSDYDRFVALSAEFRTASGMECEDASWADTASYLANPTKDSANNGRPWTYQTCNEFGYYQTTDSSNQPFHSWKPLAGLDFSHAICKAAFSGWTADPQVAWINQQYGSNKIAGTNIALVAGTIDPWHALGVTNATTATNPLPQGSEHNVYISETAHCADLYAPNAASDPDSLTFARQEIAGLVSKWLE